MIPQGLQLGAFFVLRMLIPARRRRSSRALRHRRGHSNQRPRLPPTIVGLGIAAASTSAVPPLPSSAATRPLGTTSADPEGAQVEARLSLASIRLVFGPQGLAATPHRARVHVERDGARHRGPVADQSARYQFPRTRHCH